MKKFGVLVSAATCSRSRTSKGRGRKWKGKRRGGVRLSRIRGIDWNRRPGSGGGIRALRFRVWNILERLGAIGLLHQKRYVLWAFPAGSGVVMAEGRIGTSDDKRSSPEWPEGKTSWARVAQGPARQPRWTEHRISPEELEELQRYFSRVLELPKDKVLASRKQWEKRSILV